MLKIKADKMGELEKFGFKKTPRKRYVYEVDEGFGSSGWLTVDVDISDEYKTSNELCLFGDILGDVGAVLLKKLYDLIKADMVEVCDD